MYPYINSVEKTSELINYQTVINSVPTIRSHFFSQPGSLFWDFLSSHLKELPAYWDHQIFAGAIASVSLMIFFCTFYIPHYFKALNLAELRIFAITGMLCFLPVSYTHLRAHETVLDLVCRLLLEKKKEKK